MSIIKQLFQKNEAETKKREPAFIQVGDVFPLELLKATQSARETIFGFVSFSCSHCIDLFPEIREASVGIKECLFLVTDGEEKDNQELIDYFNYDFSILSWQQSFSSIGVRSTPTFYHVNSLGYVTREQMIKNTQELKAFFKEVST